MVKKDNERTGASIDQVARAAGVSPTSVSHVLTGARPVSADMRARVLAALAAVDAVAIFGEPTPLELIVATRPDTVVILCSTYNPQDLPPDASTSGPRTRSKLSPAAVLFCPKSERISWAFAPSMAAWPSR